MPKPTCVQCSSDDSLLWRSAENGQICNECHLANTASKEAKAPDTSVRSEQEDKRDDKDDDSKNGKSEGESTPAKATGKGTRKSTRSTRYKTKTPALAASKAPAQRGRGRRSLLKRAPLRAPTATATVVTSDSLFYRGNYMQVPVTLLPCSHVSHTHQEKSSSHIFVLHFSFHNYYTFFYNKQY